MTKVARQRGFAVMEAAVWCLLFIPCVLIGIALYALAHDHNVVQMLPESLMRETSGRVMTWRSDGDEGFFDVNQSRLNALIEGLSDRAVTALQRGAFKLGSLSSRACYWVYEVDPASGVVVDAPLAGDCRTRGADGASLSLEIPRVNRLTRGVAKPIVSGGGVVEFVSRVVLVGVAVGGRFDGLSQYFRDELVEHGAVWVPREDVAL